jgi:hypothetical protein
VFEHDAIPSTSLRSFKSVECVVILMRGCCVIGQTEWRTLVVLKRLVGSSEKRCSSLFALCEGWWYKTSPGLLNKTPRGRKEGGVARRGRGEGGEEERSEGDIPWRRPRRWKTVLPTPSGPPSLWQDGTGRDFTLNRPSQIHPTRKLQPFLI